MDDWRIEGVAVRAGIEDAVSGVGEAVVEGVGETRLNIKLIEQFHLHIYAKWVIIAMPV